MTYSACASPPWAWLPSSTKADAMAASDGRNRHNGAMGYLKKVSLAVVGLVLGGSLAACDDGRSGAEEAAKQLASAVSSLDVGSLPLEGKDGAAANEQLHEVFGALEPA